MKNKKKQTPGRPAGKKPTSLYHLGLDPDEDKKILEYCESEEITPRSLLRKLVKNFIVELEVKSL